MVRGVPTTWVRNPADDAQTNTPFTVTPMVLGKLVGSVCVTFPAVVQGEYTGVLARRPPPSIPFTATTLKVGSFWHQSTCPLLRGAEVPFDVFKSAGFPPAKRTTRSVPLR